MKHFNLTEKQFLVIMEAGNNRDEEFNENLQYKAKFIQKALEIDGMFKQKYMKKLIPKEEF